MATVANEQKVRTVKLDVSAPFHSSYMKNTAKALQEEFVKFTFNIPQIEVISNFLAVPFKDSKDIEEGLIKQTYSTVRWYESIQCMKDLNTNYFFEIGFGSTLCNIIKRIDRKLHTKNICSSKEIEALAKEVL